MLSVAAIAAQSQTAVQSGTHVDGRAQVFGAGSPEVNGDYPLIGELSGKNFYCLSGSDSDRDAISWDGSKWNIYNHNRETIYDSPEDVLEPWMVGTWNKNKGNDPVPTVI